MFRSQYKWASSFVLLLVAHISIGMALAENRKLPLRDGPPVETTSGVPHVQKDLQVVPDVRDALLGRVAKLPDLDIRRTVISMPGAQGFWLSEAIDLARPDVIVGGREFAHLHPDGSLHASLPPERAKQLISAGWGVAHPWADQRPGWEGFVMLFTPRTMAEMEITFGLIVDGYNFVTGRLLDPEDF